MRGAMGFVAALAVGLALVWNGALVAQSQAPGAHRPRRRRSWPPLFGRSASSRRVHTDLFNRPIVVFRASVLGRGPFERAAGARRILDDIVERSAVGPVDSQPIDGGSLIRVNSRAVFGVATADVDDLAGETLEGVTARTVANLQQAIAEASEARTPGLLFRAAALSAVRSPSRSLRCGPSSSPAGGEGPPGRRRRTHARPDRASRHRRRFAPLVCSTCSAG